MLQKNSGDICKSMIVFILTFIFIFVPLIIWVDHFKPFVAMKNFIFIAGIILCLMLFIFDIIMKGKIIIRKERLFLAVLLYYIVNVISFFLFKYTDKIYFFIINCLVVLFFLVAYNIDSKSQKYIIYGLFFASFISSIYGFFQYLGIDYPLFVNYFGSRSEAGMRIFTTFGNPNILGGFSVFMIPLILGFIIHNHKKVKELVILSILLILNVIILIMSQTRGSWVAAIFSLFVFLMLYFRKYGFAFIKNNKIIASSILIITIIISIFGFNYLLSSEDYLNPTTANIRLFYYQNTLNMITENPIIFLFGRGIGTFNVYYPLYRDNRLAYQTGETAMEFRVEHPHNEHLEILHDLGIVGYLIFLWIIFEALYLLLKRSDAISLGLSVALIALLVDGLMSQNLRFVSIVSLLWLAIGFSVIKKEYISEKNNYFTLIKTLLSLFVIVLLCFPLYDSYKIMKADSYLKSGISYYISNIPQQAVYQFEKVVSLDKTNKRALYYLAPSYSSVGKTDEAFTTYLELLKIDPNFIQTNYRLAVLYLDEKDVHSAKKYLLKQISVNNMYWQAYYALSYLSIADKKEALFYLEEIENIIDISQSEISISELIDILKLQAQLYSEINDLNNTLRILYKLNILTDDEDIVYNINEIEKILGIVN